MGERGSGGACPSPAGIMHFLGVVFSWCGIFLEGLLILRGVGTRMFKVFPLFFSYLAFCFSTALCVYLISWRLPGVYPSAYWLYYLVTILVEFTVLVEISDHIFRPFPALRSLGRALTILISVALGLVYILPTILRPTGRSRTLLDFALRASVTKALILLVLFYVARHYGTPLGKNLAGIMLGFSIYLGLNVVMMTGAKAYGSALYGQVLWFMAPLGLSLCALVWTVALWDLVPVPRKEASPTDLERNSETVALELTRFNNELSKLMHK
ncbi:MAG TPA: hypothetical protein VMO17_08795 [Terriglobia bacterium]|nr:hypothetical protein [Terriglobia bacterium]